MWKSITVTICILTVSSVLTAESRTVHIQRDRIVPKGYTIQQPLVKRYTLDDGVLHIYSRGFKQGDACYVELTPRGKTVYESVAMELLFIRDGSEDSCFVRLKKTPWGYGGFFPIHPETVPGKQILWITYGSGGKSGEKRFPFSIGKQSFETSENVLAFKHYNTGKPMSEKTRAFIQRCSEKKKKVFSRVSVPSVDNKMAHPRGMHFVTSSFWKTRRYVRYRQDNGIKVRLEDSVKIHRGLDLRGKRGTPVYAMARGEVVLAEKMYYEGNLLILDHGDGIFSYYMHLDSFEANVGDTVDAGTLIARVGSSGRSTAPHLHVSVVMCGVQVDPLSMLSLPVR